MRYTTRTGTALLTLFLITLFVWTGVAEATVAAPPATGTLSGRIDYPTFSTPFGIAISPDGTSVYVTGLFSGTVSLFTRNTSTGALSGRIEYQTGANSMPSSVVVSPDGTSVYVTNSSSNTIALFPRNISTGVLSPVFTVVTTLPNPQFITISPDGRSIYVTNPSNNISLFTRDTTTGNLSGRIDYVAGATPQGIAVSPDGTSVYVSNYGDSTISLFPRDVSTGVLYTPVGYATGLWPQGITVSPDGTSVYVTNSGSGTVSLFPRANGGTLSARTDYPTAANPFGVVVSSDNASVYVADLGSSGVTSFITFMTRATGPVNNGTLSGRIDYITGLNPYNVIVSADGTSVYTPNYGANTASLFTRAVGAGAVNVSSNVASSWTITGPATINGSGTSQSNPSEPTGTYTINWGNVPGYSTPSTQSLTLSASGSSISFNANYLPLSCSSQTINNCDLPTTASGNTAGSCAAGFSNSCTYSCTAGVWTLSSNTCGPTATLSASPTTISSGQFSTLKWSSPNAISCTSLGGFSTGGATSGTATVSPVSTSNYEISCTGAGSSLGHSNIASVTVVVANISITAIPTRVVKGGSTTVSWNATSVSACEITKNGSPWKSYTAVSGTVSGSSVENNINAQTTYIMSCVTPASPVYIPSTPLIVNIPSILNQF